MNIFWLVIAFGHHGKHWFQVLSSCLHLKLIHSELTRFRRLVDTTDE